MTGGPVTDTAGGPADVAGHRAWLSPSEDGRSARAAAEVGPPGAPDPARPVLTLHASTEHPESATAWTTC
jgi:hypothetical protein